MHNDKLTRFKEKHSGYVAPSIIADPNPISKIKDITSDSKWIKVKGRLNKVRTIRSKSKPHLEVYSSDITDGTGQLRVVWFNMPGVVYAPGGDQEYVFMGKIQHKPGQKTLVSPAFTTVEDMDKWKRRASKELGY